MKIIVGSPNLFPFCILYLLHYDMMASAHTPQDLGLIHIITQTLGLCDNVLGYE